MPAALPDDDDWIRAHFRTIGRRVVARRTRLKLTQETVFLAAGVDRRSLQTLEAGEGNPTLATLMRIARVLDVPLEQLVQERPPSTGDEGGRGPSATGPVGKGR
ncbi:helix-turn-helix transcriptional regulator [Streptomyces antibioticus]